MKLQHYDNAANSVTLPNSLRWDDEFSWDPYASKAEYLSGGSLEVQMSEKLAGRPITLVPPFQDMAWVPRSVVTTLQGWLATPGKELRLLLEYPTDTRQFKVMFDPNAQQKIEATPVQGFPQHTTDEWFRLTLRLITI